MRLDSSLNLIDFSGRPRSSRIDFLREPFLILPQVLELVPFSLHLPRSHLVQFLQSRPTLNSGSSFSSSDSLLCFSFLTPSSSGLSVGLPCSSSLHQFPGAGRRTLRCVLLVLPAVAAAAVAGHRSLSNKVLSIF